jgi:hypothetical protein
MKTEPNPHCVPAFRGYEEAQKSPQWRIKVKNFREYGLSRTQAFSAAKPPEKKERK